MQILKRIWEDISRGENIDLYLTVVVAFGLVVLNLLGLASASLIAPITLAVLGLLAIATLGTRYHIEKQLQRFTLSPPSGLRGRSELPSFRERGNSASEIIIVGVSLISAVTPNLDFFEQAMKSGCKIRFLLLDPASPAIQTWTMLSKFPDIQLDIRQTLKSLDILVQMKGETRGSCEVRLAPVFLPFGVAAFDPNKENGLMNVESLIYKGYLGDRPHILLTKAGDAKWFDFFKSQYEQLWDDSKIWTPTNDL
jgi:hypothetical protein